jgi:pimeloyl-ACP methyl ester carboxylesterase
MRFFILITLSILCSGCFRRFVMTEKELKAYYRNKPVKPVYFTITNDSVSLFCATAGADTLPPLLVIHGAPGAWYGSRNLLDDSTIRSRYHIISVDRLGYNKSRFKGKRYAMTSIDMQAIAIYEALRLNRSFKTGVVMGSSYGAPIAAKMAIMHPESFHHLIMLAPAIDPDKEKFWWFHPYIRGGLIRWLLPRFLKNATAEKFSHVAELRRLQPLWARLQTPVTVAQGDADQLVDPANLEFARKMLNGKQAEFISIPGGGHLVRWQHPELVNSILEKIRDGARPLQGGH